MKRSLSEDDDIGHMDHQQFCEKLIEFIHKYYDPKYHSMSSGILYTP